MNGSPTQDLADAAAAFVDLIGAKPWMQHISDLRSGCADGQRTGRALLERCAIAVAIERLRRRGRNTAPSRVELTVARLAGELTAAAADLPRSGRDRLRSVTRQALQEDSSLVPLFHIARTAQLQRGRGFTVDYAGFADDAPFDLLLSRDGSEAELACDVVSAEEGRDLHRGAWVRLVDRIDPDLQTWLASHPGRYLLKMTLPQGLRTGPDGRDDRLADLHARIRTLLQSQRRADYDEAAVLRLDPLILAGSQADELGLLARLRREFGHEAHLAVTGGKGGVFVMAARAGREDSVPSVIRRRLAALAPRRLTGSRPGILAMLIDDTDRIEWLHLRDRLILESEARQFLTGSEARGVVAVTCISRLELLDEDGPDAVPEGELRYCNPSHPNAREAALAPAITSST